MATVNKFPTKDPTEAVVLTFDFAAELSGGETLTGTPTVAVTVVRSSDAAPTAILAIGAAFDGTSTKYLVPVTGGLSGVDYDVKVTAATTNTKKTLALAGILPVRAQ